MLFYDALATSQPEEVISSLLSSGADPNAEGEHGELPLTTALRSYEDAGVLKLLLQAGADPSLEDKCLQSLPWNRGRGRTTVWQLVRQNHWRSRLDLFCEFGYQQTPEDREVGSAADARLAALLIHKPHVIQLGYHTPSSIASGIYQWDITPLWMTSESREDWVWKPYDKDLEQAVLSQVDLLTRELDRIDGWNVRRPSEGTPFCYSCEANSAGVGASEEIANLFLASERHRQTEPWRASRLASQSVS